MRSMVPWRNILSTECFLNYLLKTTSVFLWLNWKCCISNITVLWKYGSNPSCCRYVNWWIKLRDLKPLYYTWNLCFYLNIEGFSAFSSKCKKLLESLLRKASKSLNLNKDQRTGASSTQQGNQHEKGEMANKLWKTTHQFFWRWDRKYTGH